jgi:hypothetical protein
MEGLICYIDNIKPEIHIRNIQTIEGDIVSLREKTGRYKSLCREFNNTNPETISKFLSTDRLYDKENNSVCEECRCHLPEGLSGFPFEENIKIDSGKKSLAKSVIEKLDRLYKEGETRNEVNPDAFVDRWQNTDFRLRDNRIQERLIKTSNIIGSTSRKRLIPQRLEYVLFKMIHNSWYRQYHNPISVVENQREKYFISKDGNHRAIAYKIAGIEHIYASVQSIKSH